MTSLGADGAMVRYRVTDAAGGLTAGAGCTATVDAVECLLPPSRPASSCYHLFCPDQGRGVAISMVLGGGNGADSVRAGAGRDHLEAGDGVPDHDDDALDCGSGDDRGVAEARDLTKHCEKVKRERAL